MSQRLFPRFLLVLLIVLLAGCGIPFQPIAKSTRAPGTGGASNSARIHRSQPPANVLPVYWGGLEPAWDNWTWDSTVDFKDTAYPNDGPYDISWTALKGDAELNFQTTAGVNTTGYQSLVFKLRPTQSGDPVLVLLVDRNKQTIKPGVDLGNYGGPAVAGKYTEYQIPLAALGGTHAIITGIQIVNAATTGEPPVYVSDLGFQK